MTYSLRSQSSNPMIQQTINKALFTRSDYWPFLRKNPGDDMTREFYEQKFVTAASLNAVRNDPELMALNELGEYTGITRDAMTASSDPTVLEARQNAKYGKWIEITGENIFPKAVSNSYFMTMNEISNTSPNNFYTLEGWNAQTTTTNPAVVVRDYAWSVEMQKIFKNNQRVGEKISDGRANWNAHYMTSYERGTNSGHTCISFKPKEMGSVELLSVTCDQVNRRPICKIPLQVHLADQLQCPAQVIENPQQHVCGDNVSQVRAKTSTVGITREATEHQKAANWKQGTGITAYSPSVTEKFMKQVLFDNTKFGDASEIDDHYGMKIPQFLNTRNTGQCQCDCPKLEPIWRASNRGNDIVNADKCVKTFCCAEGYQVNLGAQRYNTLNDNRCFRIEADDEFENRVNAPFWLKDQDLLAILGHTNLNTRKVWHDTEDRVDGIRYNSITEVDATCVCKTAQCPATGLASGWTINRQLQAGQNIFTPVSPSTTATFRCPNGQQLVEDGRVSPTGEATAECKAYENGQCGARWVIPNVRCEQKKTCSVDCHDAPHGRYTVTINGVTKDVVTVDKATTTNPQTQIKIGEKVSFSCNAGYDLYFSGTNIKASEQQCCQECFEPVTRNGVTLGGWENQLAVLDPRVCECRPKQCEPILMADVYNLEETKHGIYVNTNDQDKLGTSAVKAGKGMEYAAGKMFNAVGYHDWYRASCGRYDLSSPDNIRFHERTGMSEKMYSLCADPSLCRRVTCSQPPVAPNACRSLDRLRLTPTNQWEQLSRFNFHDEKDANNRDKEVHDDFTSQGVSYSRSRSMLTYADLWEYVINGKTSNIKNPRTQDNVYPGAQYKAVCRKGSKPYLKFAEALVANNFGAIKGESSVIYTCNANGEWETKHECRCENHVNPCEALNDDGSRNYL